MIVYIYCEGSTEKILVDQKISPFLQSEILFMGNVNLFVNSVRL